MSLTKADMISKLFDQVGLNKRESQEIVDGFFNTIKKTLVAKEEVKISGFGKFRILDKKARPGRNPKTGEEVIIAPRSVVSFSCSHKLREHLTEAMKTKKKKR